LYYLDASTEARNWGHPARLPFSELLNAGKCLPSLIFREFPVPYCAILLQREKTKLLSTKGMFIRGDQALAYGDIFKADSCSLNK
jgi:hypothetical protein